MPISPMSEQTPQAAPFVVTLLSDVGTPVSVFHKLIQGASTGFLFESTEGDSRLARYSIIGVNPIKTISFKNGEAVLCDHVNDIKHAQSVSNPLQLLSSILEKESRALSTKRLPFPFSGGLVGYLGYGATRYFEGIAQQSHDPFGVPEGYWGLYDSMVVFDHQFRTINVISHRGQAHARGIVETLTAPCRLEPLLHKEGDTLERQVFDGVTGPFTEDSFVSLVSQSKAYIVEGQVFQIVLSQRFSLPVTSQPLDVYRLLQSVNPSPYAYFLKFPEFAYLGSSPETFVQCQDGRVILRALAGTRPRGATDEEDSRLSSELRSNEKELAEHMMLVDLGRNDLGRVCRAGSVRTGPIATVSKYRHVMHLATEIEGMLRADRTCFDVFQSCFPRGTVSGAPKVRAMELLACLEPEQRGIYSGVVGYFDLHGNMDGAIAIRSALIKDGWAHVNAGAGVVFDSDPLSEYHETRNKARSVISALKLAEQSKRAGQIDPQAR